ncbi:circadian clock KaiB family protein [Leptolyngbya sp. 'hensonii']|uniref:circadian clock KaiB family protein n=1 Tax=Leptolyngbya sp. 'hensonii' TaxID=1922337 RepID=UPI00209B7023|nr:circadian clock KaiB family protein [Leptolyngbya sp. 'hensonii']
MSLPPTFKGIALFTPGADLVYCIDPNKQNRWHLQLCAALQEFLGLPEPPHFLIPCYTATLDLWLNPRTQQIEVFAEAYPLVLRHQTLLNAVFGTDNLTWKAAERMEGACDPVVLSTYRAQFPQLWEEHDLILRIDQLNREISSVWLQRSPPNHTSLDVQLLKYPFEPRSGSAETAGLAQGNSAQGYVLRLFVSGHHPGTEKALQRLHQVLERSLQLPYTLKVIDVLKYPELAEVDQVSATPTLVRAWPLPVRRLVGELDNLDRVLQVIGS